MKITKKSTMREVLQVLGTNCMRDNFYSQVWVNALMSEYTSLYQKETIAKYGDFKLKTEGIYPNWIITDSRFHNELQAIKDRKGICIRVNRNIYPTYNDSQVVDKLTEMGYFVDKDNFEEMALNEGFDWNDDKEYWTLDSDLPIDNDNHLSEIEWRSWDKFDYVIDNNGTIEELIIQVKQFLITYKLLD